MPDQFNMYSKKVMDYFLHPKNIGVIKNADGIGTVGNPRCGDIMKIYIRVGKRVPLKAQSSKLKAQKEEYIKDIKVQTLGCGAAIATSSIITEMVKGKNLDDALKVSNLDVAKELGGLPPVKMHCSLLAKEGIESAIKDYRKKHVKKG